MKIDGKAVVLFNTTLYQNCCVVTLYNTETSSFYTYGISDEDDYDESISRILYVFHSEESRNKIMLCGWHCHKYDCAVINYIIRNSSNDVKPYDILYFQRTSDEYEELHPYNEFFYSIDFCKMLFNDKERCSLRQMAFSLGLSFYDKDGIHDNHLPIHMIHSIAKNRMLVFTQIFDKNIEKLSYRRKILKEYKMDVLSCNDTIIGLKLLTKRYLQLTKKKYNDIQSLRSTASICTPDSIIPYQYTFATDDLRRFWDSYKNVNINPLDSEKKSFNKVFNVGTLPLSITSGGVRSVNSPHKFNSFIYKIDFSSMFPTVMCKFNLFPRHLEDDFKKVYNDIRIDRIKAKESNREEKSKALKNVLNSTIGLMNSDWSWLYDPNMSLAIRLTSMKIILSLIDYFTSRNIKILQVNIDGLFITTSFDESAIERMVNNVLYFGNITDFQFKIERYNMLCQYSVNDYVASTGDIFPFTPESLVTKGIFKQQEQGRALRPRIVTDAIINWMLFNTPVARTIDNCSRIDYFLTSINIDNRFSVYNKGKRIFNLVRYYYTNSGDAEYILKEKESNPQIADKGGGVRIVEDLESLENETFENLKVNKAPYYRMANNIIMQFSQGELFDIFV